MRNLRFHFVLALLLAAPFVLSGCLTMPTIADRVVELVTTTSVADTLHASGSTNTITNNGGFDVNNIDIAGILDNAGIDVSSVTGISLSSVAYRIVNPDPVSTRHLSGTLRTSVAGGPAVDLVNPFNANAGAHTGLIPVALGATGKAQINGLLATLLDHVKNGTGPVPNGTVTYVVSGNSTPPDNNTNFDYEVRITMSVQGTVKTKILTGK